MYQEKQDDYFGSGRPEIYSHLPDHVKAALDVGCGDGVLLGAMRKEKRCDEAWGIEFVEDAAARADQVLDKVLRIDLDQDGFELPDGYFDLILCLDVLEHLSDPWGMLKKLNMALKPGGRVIVSLPNLRYWTVLRDLVLRGRFEYEEFGILDRTHLRFFTVYSARVLLEGAGLHGVCVQQHPTRPSGKLRFLDLITFGQVRDIFAWQLIVTGYKK